MHLVALWDVFTTLDWFRRVGLRATAASGTRMTSAQRPPTVITARVWPMGEAGGERPSPAVVATSEIYSVEPRQLNDRPGSPANGG